MLCNPVWHQPNSTAQQVVNFLAINLIPFKEEPSTAFKDHTCFLVGYRDKFRVPDLLAKNFGRFIEDRDIVLTKKERAAIDNKRAQTDAEIAEKERLFNEKKEKEDEIIARIEAQLRDKRQDKKDDAEIAAIEQLITKEEEEENVEV